MLFDRNYWIKSNAPTPIGVGVLLAKKEEQQTEIQHRTNGIRTHKWSIQIALPFKLWSYQRIIIINIVILVCSGVREN